MKKETPARIRRRALLLVLLFAITLLQMPITAWAEERAMATRVTEESLISSVSNPSNGKIQFYINVPAGETVSYSVDLIPNDRTDSVDTKTGSYTNSGTSAVSKKITVTAKYFSNKYTIYASYTTGPSASRTIHEDTDSATSALKSSVTSERFVWTQSLIDAYNTAGFVTETLVQGVTAYVSFKLVKKYDAQGTAALFETVVGAAGSASDFFYEKTGNITTTPKLGWGYEVVLVPTTGGYIQYVVECNEEGNRTQTVSAGTISLSTITVGVR